MPPMRKRSAKPPSGRQCDTLSSSSRSCSTSRRRIGRASSGMSVSSSPIADTSLATWTGPFATIIPNSATWPRIALMVWVRRHPPWRFASSRSSSTRGSGKPDHGYVPRAREVELDPLRELPYGPAACDSRSKRPDTCQHPTTLRARRKIRLAPAGASTHVHDEMDSEPLRDLSVDLFEELQEFDCPMTLVAFADDEPRGNVERCKKRGRAMPHVAVCVRRSARQASSARPAARDRGPESGFSHRC